MNYLYLYHYILPVASATGHWLSFKHLGLARAMALAMLMGIAAVVSTTGAQAAEPAAAVTAVNINAADAQTLAAGLRGVGEARAQEIIRYREAYGPFASVDELAEVKGIGQSTVDRNRSLITLE